MAVGDNGIIRSAKPGIVYADMSTISPRVTREIHDELAGRGVAMLDAPVSGGQVGAVNGTLAIMVGGEREAFERMLPAFHAMGKTVTYCGPSGSGQSTKLCNQVVCCLTLQAVCEGLVLATKSGLDPTVLIEAIKGGSAGSWLLTTLGAKMIARDFAPGFMIDLQQKDLRLVMEAAQELHLPLPGTAMVHQLFSATSGGWRGAGWDAIPRSRAGANGGVRGEAEIVQEESPPVRV